MIRTRLLLLALPVALLVPASARADDPVDRPTAPDDASRHEIDRTWLYTDDARVAAPLTLLVTSSLSYTSVGNSPSRVVNPFPGCPAPCNTYNALGANTGLPGGMLQVGAELGLVQRLSVMAVAQVGVGGADNVPSPNVGALVGLRFQVFPSEWRNLHLAISGGYLREAWQGPVYDDDDNVWRPGSPNGDNGAWIQVAFSGDFGRVRVATTVHAEHVFADGRDPVDIMVQAGASYRVAGAFRLGLEYVGQDLEESFDPGAEGGARHFIGPIASLQLMNRRFSLVAGPSFGLSSTSPDVLGRLAAAYSF